MSSGASPHLVKVLSISSGGPHKCECNCLLVLTSTAPGWFEKSVFLRLLRCRAILPLFGMCPAR